MPCFSTLCPGRPPYVLFPLTAGAPSGLPLLLRKQPIWAAGGTTHLMPVEQGLSWHPVATGLAGQAIPFVVAASHVHALPSPPFWFPVLVASPALLRPPRVGRWCWRKTRLTFKTCNAYNQHNHP